VTSVETLLNADQFASLPDPDEGGKVELVDGKVVTRPPVGDEHGDRAVRLSASLFRFVDEQRLGIVRVEVGYRLGRDPDTVLAPDVSVVLAAALDSDRDRAKYLEGPPLLAVEVMSPDDREEEVGRKIARYLGAGTERVWIVRPKAQTVTVHRRGGDAHTYGMDDTLTSDDAGLPVDGFELPLRELFAPGL
jgi:Uma2 family endonuclease